MEIEYYPGKGCQCGAHSYSECGCSNVDWTDARVYRYKELLEKVLDDATGDLKGEKRVWPIRAGLHREIVLALESPHNMR